MSPRTPPNYPCKRLTCRPGPHPEGVNTAVTTVPALSQGRLLLPFSGIPVTSTPLPRTTLLVPFSAHSQQVTRTQLWNHRAATHVCFVSMFLLFRFWATFESFPPPRSRSTLSDSDMLN